ncbi:Scr1 family TA system antitoxin-like transcriptional regulator [Streptomyces andamanensis]|uniref:Scr1 family TA system antitoxin-like transcriptional regulator n=1 Tax=Streptomyces andamanensis TaxID=1565035 RepID=A0ABV8TPQ1_9ACTN
MLPTDLRALLQLYEVTDAGLVAELEDAARGSKGQSWWAQYSDVVSPQYALYLGYEGSADMIRMYNPTILPGLVQTEDYATALLSALGPESLLRQQVDLRLSRHLLSLTEHPRTNLRVLPFSAGAHFSVATPFILLSFRDDDDLLYVEGPGGGLSSRDDLALMARYQECFEEISAIAYEGDRMTDLLGAVRGSLDNS